MLSNYFIIQRFRCNYLFTWSLIFDSPLLNFPCIKERVIEIRANIKTLATLYVHTKLQCIETLLLTINVKTFVEGIHVCIVILGKEKNWHNTTQPHTFLIKTSAFLCPRTFEFNLIGCPLTMPLPCNITRRIFDFPEKILKILVINFSVVDTTGLNYRSCTGLCLESKNLNFFYFMWFWWWRDM